MSERSFIVGVDEVGRGCVYGPLCVAAVALIDHWHDARVRDSKAVKPKLRQELSAIIRRRTLWCTAMVAAEAINRFGIGYCLREAGDRVAADVVRQIVAQHPGAQIKLVYDGTDYKPGRRQLGGVEVAVDCFPKADAKVFEVSAASIIAKVLRDTWVEERAAADPSLAPYNLAVNKGYGTPDHREALEQHGFTADHRTKFCRSLINNYRIKQQDKERSKSHDTTAPATARRPTGWKPRRKAS